MTSDDMSEFHRLLRGLGVCQAQINAELAKAKPDQAKIAARLRGWERLRSGRGAVLSLREAPQNHRRMLADGPVRARRRIPLIA
jgi:hypothetical protein